LSIPNSFWALWVALSALWLADLLFDLPWASSVLNLTIEDIDNRGRIIIVASLDFSFNFYFSLSNDGSFRNDLGNDFGLGQGFDLGQVLASTLLDHWCWRVSQLGKSVPNVVKLEDKGVLSSDKSGTNGRGNECFHLNLFYYFV